MPVDFDSFVEWAKSRFDDVKVAGKEVKLNSIFTDDAKQHMWCCPKKNTYHCWKTDKSGTLPHLITIVDGCSFSEAYARLGGGGASLIGLEQKLEEAFGKSQTSTTTDAKKEGKIAFPDSTFRIAALSQDNHYRRWAEKYIGGRCLPVNNLLVCIGGKYKDRIIIPYYGPTGDLIYWSGRDMTGRALKRYDVPEKEKVGYGKEDVLWMGRWPSSGSRVYLTEGEFDAMSLTLAGLNGAACGGKNLGPRQVELLRPYKVTVAFDTDKSGGDALNKISDILERDGITNVNYVRPPRQYKDWNDMLIRDGAKLMKAYIACNERAVDTFTDSSLKLNRGGHE